MSTSPLAQPKFRFIFTICWSVWVGFYVKVLMWYGYPLFNALADSIITNGLLAGICIVVSLVLQFYLPSRQRYSYVLLLCLVLTIIWLFISRSLVLLMLNSGADYERFFSLSLPIRFLLGFLVISCMALSSVLWYTLQDQQENENRRNEAERLSKEAELYKLRQQLQPHFLFNSLNSINALIGIRPDEARTMIQQLSDFLRGTLKKEEQQWISLTEELQHLQLYLQIEKVRFGHRLTTIISNEAQSDDSKLPAMLLQPIVENAIKFGLYDTIDAITISIIAQRINNELIITVQNPYDPDTVLPMQGTGFGLQSVQRRLYLLFSRNDLLHTTAEDHIFSTTVKIPQAI